MRALLVSSNNELFNSLRRALRYLASIDLRLFSGRLTDGSTVIYVMENDDIDSWLWGQFRKKSRSPLLVLGFEDKVSFISRNPIFGVYAEEHAYFQIPFDLRNFIAKIQNMRPIYDDVTRELLVDEYSKGYEHKLITHDMKVIKGDKAASLDNLRQVRDFYQSKGDWKATRIIHEKIKAIETADDWEHVAFNLRKYLIERL
jgi:hypothetical protein